MSVVTALSIALDMDPAAGGLFAHEPTTIITEYEPYLEGDDIVVFVDDVLSWDGNQYTEEFRFQYLSDTEVVFKQYAVYDDIGNLLGKFDGNVSYTLEEVETLPFSQLYAKFFAGSDVITGSNFADVAFGLAGADLLVGRGGADVIYGNQGNDIIYGNTDNDVIHGGQDNDVIHGGKHADVIYGNMQNDIIYGNMQNDVLYGGQDDDVLYGGQDDDILHGNKGNDTLYGNKGDDVLYGGDGVNTLNGGTGSDTFYVDGDDIVLDQTEEDVLIWL